MSDAHRNDGAHAHEAASAAGRDAKIEQLLLLGLDHYLASQYEQAINVWTRVLFLDRNHARARAYIERARSALAERQRESEELLQNGMAAFQRGQAPEARRLLEAAIEGGAPSDQALAVLDRLNRLETIVAQTAAPHARRAPRSDTPLSPIGHKQWPAVLAATMIVVAATALGGYLTLSPNRPDWQVLQKSATTLVAKARRILYETPVPATPPPVVRSQALPLPRRGETALTRARALFASGNLRDALTTLDAVRPTDSQKDDADKLRGDIQRQLLALTPLTGPPARFIPLDGVQVPGASRGAKNIP
jgi:tetratricopeptide (TPR) repeat protein